MRSVVRWCALAIGIWVLVTSPSDIFRTIHFVGTLDTGSADDAIMAYVLMPSLWFLRLATVWALLRAGWSAFSRSRAKVCKFKPRPLPKLHGSDSGQWRKSWTR